MNYRPHKHRCNLSHADMSSIHVTHYDKVNLEEKKLRIGEKTYVLTCKEFLYQLEKFPESKKLLDYYFAFLIVRKTIFVIFLQIINTS